MSEQDELQCLMVGLPRTGKTTYLAALWHVLRSDEVKDSLRLDRREGDQEYLNLIAAEWLKCVALERTPGDQTKVAIRLRDPSNGRVVNMKIPDISGEIYSSLWETRTCLCSFADLIAESDGCLLFIHPGKLIETALIDDANCTLVGWESETPGNVDAERAGKQSEDATKEWEPRFSPTQVQMVEILQFFRELARKRRFRIVIVISAWDLTRDEYPPDQWLENHLPLLWQYLLANTDKFDFSVMGVSAQGGEVSGSSSIADELLDLSVASQRIRVVMRGKEGRDISEPIRCLMN